MDEPISSPNKEAVLSPFEIADKHCLLSCEEPVCGCYRRTAHLALSYANLRYETIANTVGRQEHDVADHESWLAKLEEAVKRRREISHEIALLVKLTKLAEEAKALGLYFTISNQPGTPLAMRNYKQVVEFRRIRS